MKKTLSSIILANLSAAINCTFLRVKFFLSTVGSLGFLFHRICFIRPHGAQGGGARADGKPAQEARWASSVCGGYAACRAGVAAAACIEFERPLLLGLH